jgi:hypothetical protein
MAAVRLRCGWAVRSLSSSLPCRDDNRSPAVVLRLVPGDFLPYGHNYRFQPVSGNNSTPEDVA